MTPHALHACAPVGIGAIPHGLGLEVELRMALPGLSHREAEVLAHKVHRVCPYANATRGNIAVRLVLVSSHVSLQHRPRERLVRGTLPRLLVAEHLGKRAEGGKHGPS